MHKVVVERERGGARGNRKWGKRLAFSADEDYENEPTFASSARRRQYYRSKWFTDVLGPLEGYLRANLGRPWDKVFGELRQGLDVRKVTGRHIFDHLKCMVETDCWVGDDRRVYLGPSAGEVTGFYVHPRSGLLSFVPRLSARQRKKARLLRQDVDEIRLDRRRSYKRIDGLWYFVVYEDMPGMRGETRQAWDVVERREVKLDWDSNHIAVSKRQCDHAEVRKIQARIAEWKKEVRRM